MGLWNDTTAGRFALTAFTSSPLFCIGAPRRATEHTKQGVSAVSGPAPAPGVAGSAAEFRDFGGPRGEKRAMENAGSEYNFDKQLAIGLQCISFLFSCTHMELCHLEGQISATDGDLFGDKDPYK